MTAAQVLAETEAAPPSRPPAPSAGRALSPRRRPALSARTREDREFLPAHLEILDTPASPRATVLLWVITATVAGALAWSALAQIDIFAVASGRVQVSGRSKVVQPFDPGRVSAILVENGFEVKAGDPLVRLDPTEAQAELSAKVFQENALRAEILRRDAEIAAIKEDRRDTAFALPEIFGAIVRARELANFQAELSQYMSTRDGLLSQVDEKAATKERFVASAAARERLVAVLRERADMREILVSKSAGTRAAVLDALQIVEQTMADLAYDRGQIAEAEAGVVSGRRRIEQLRDETVAQQTQKVSEAVQKLDALRQDVVKARDRLERTQLRSPIDGTVQQLAVTSLGQVVSAGQPLMIVVPTGGQIEVEALILNRDAAFVEVGQRAVVKIDAFPFTRYGTLEGIVTRLSRDAIDERDASGGTDTLSVAGGQSVGRVTGTPRTQNLVFQATVRLDQPFIRVDGTLVPLTPGMTTVVEVQTGRRRVIDYVLSPIRETAWSALHER